MTEGPGGRIGALLGAAVVGQTPVGGGSISPTWRVTLSDGRIVFAKTARDDEDALLLAEAHGLSALAAARGGPPVPEVLHASPQLLVLEWFQPGRLDAAGWEELGAALARLHRNTSPRFGFDQDGFIGATPQPNPWSEDGVAFFAEHRLGYQVARAARAGLLDARSTRRAEAIIGRLASLLPTGEPASLLHGDLWSGNVLARNDGVGCLVDPAPWFGYREADLAMTRLFGTLPASFHGGYEAEWPLPPGASERVALFNLYHLLNHLNLFGQGYRGSVEAVLERYA